MGSLLREQGKLEEAMPYYIEALEARRRVLGDEHRSTLISINHIGNLLKVQSKYEEAESYYMEDLEVSRRILGDEHPDTLVAISALISLYDAWKKPEKAAEYGALLEVIEAKNAETTEPVAP